MAHSVNEIPEDLDRLGDLSSPNANNMKQFNSAVSWGAITAGAATAASLSLILLILGVGLGLSSVSPWSREGINATSFGLSTIIWLTFTQLFASAAGGYLAGRLRNKWTGSHIGEVYFRDIVHGFLAWGVASLATAALLYSVIACILSGGLQASASMVGGVASTAGAAVDHTINSSKSMAPGNEGESMNYFVDSLFRRGAAGVSGPESARSSAITDTNEQTIIRNTDEIGRIFKNITLSEPLPPEDIGYVSQIVAQRTGLSLQDAEKRVVDVYAKAQVKLRDAEVAAGVAVDKARKASAYSAIGLSISLIVGAFFGSLAAIFGGKNRDRVMANKSASGAEIG